LSPIAALMRGTFTHAAYDHVESVAGA